MSGPEDPDILFEDENPVDNLKYRALQALADEQPNSIVADMLTHFDKATVLQILVLYGGTRPRIPKVDQIWNQFRNQTIVDNLDVRNDRVTRHQLAEYFGILDNDVSMIYSKAKQKKKYLSNSQVRRVVETLYKKNVEAFHKDMKALFSNKYGVEYFSLHDKLQDPEDQYLLREAVDKLKERCRAGVMKHPIFIGREYKIDYALKLVMDKIEENH